MISALTLMSCATHPKLISKIEPQKNFSISNSIQDDENIKNFIEPYKEKMIQAMNKKISHTNVELNKNGDNCNLGELLADQTFEGAEEWANKNGLAKIDAAVINIGGIRSTIGVGDILLRHIYEVMPFENEVMIVKMKGSDLHDLFNYYATTKMNNPVSHLFIETKDGKVLKALINGKEINENQDYYIATSNYLAFGGDDMKFFSKGKLISTEIKLRDLFIEKFKQNPEISAPSDVRLILHKN